MKNHHINDNMTKQDLSFPPFLYHILALNMKTVCISGETAEYFHYFSLISLKICSGSFHQIGNIFTN